MMGESVTNQAASEPAARTKVRLQNIDGLRGIAAVMVVVSHWCETVALQTIPASFKEFINFAFVDWFSSGRCGVVAFFCISGFVVPFSFNGRLPLYNFVVSRFFRLFPAYWLALALTIGLGLATGLRYDVFNVAANASMLTYFFGQPYILGVAWTLTVELIFYGICFCAFAAHVLHSARFNFSMILAFCALALAMAGYRFTHPGSSLPVGTMTYLAAMHFGTLIRLWRLEHDRKAARLGWAALAILFAATALAYCLAYPPGSHYKTGSETDLSLTAITLSYFVGVLLFIACVWQRWFSSGIMAFFGAISYAIYLVHPVLLTFTISLWGTFADWKIALATLSLAYLNGAVALSALIYYYVERPSIKFGHRVSAR